MGSRAVMRVSDTAGDLSSGSARLQVSGGINGPIFLTASGSLPPTLPISPLQSQPHLTRLPSTLETGFYELVSMTSSCECRGPTPRSDGLSINAYGQAADQVRGLGRRAKAWWRVTIGGPLGFRAEEHLLLLALQAPCRLP